MARKLTVLLYVWFSVYEVSPTPPITVTHKPEEDTFGVSHSLVKRKVFTDAVVYQASVLVANFSQYCLIWNSSIRGVEKP